jgi:hypothetical protein
MELVGSAPWPFFNRADEIEAFRRTLRVPRRRAFFIYGRPGTGKTRLAEECTELARQEGWQCLRAVASEVAQAVPLGAIGHLLPAHVTPADPVALISQTLQGLAAGGEIVVLFIDDAHLLDTTSAVLVGGLLNTGRVFLVCTVRSAAACTGGPTCWRSPRRGASARAASWASARTRTRSPITP